MTVLGSHTALKVNQTKTSTNCSCLSLEASCIFILMCDRRGIWCRSLGLRFHRLRDGERWVTDNPLVGRGCIGCRVKEWLNNPTSVRPACVVIGESRAKQCRTTLGYYRGKPRYTFQRGVTKGGLKGAREA